MLRFFENRISMLKLLLKHWDLSFIFSDSQSLNDRFCSVLSPHFSSKKWWAQSWTYFRSSLMFGLPFFAPLFLFEKWWAQMDSNHRPHAYQACALTTWAMRPVWWRWGGSNSWPPACKAGALPAELHPHCLTSSFFNLPFSFRYPQNWTMSFSTFLLFPLIDL